MYLPSVVGLQVARLHCVRVPVQGGEGGEGDGGGDGCGGHGGAFGGAEVQHGGSA